MALDQTRFIAAVGAMDIDLVIHCGVARGSGSSGRAAHPPVCRAVRLAVEADLLLPAHRLFCFAPEVARLGAELRLALRASADHLRRRVAAGADDGGVGRVCPVADTQARKGMLTGPVTMLQWSFVRDDSARDTVCRQIALALRDEVLDLESAGIKIIQIDEPALREGLPLRRGDWAEYLHWAVGCFRLAAAGVGDGTQIHTHMCYGEFNDIIDAIGAMDADVISIETSRSKMELLDAFSRYRYPNEIGPGVTISIRRASPRRGR